jgi:hypothetical protein
VAITDSIKGVLKSQWKDYHGELENLHNAVASNTSFSIIDKFSDCVQPFVVTYLTFCYFGLYLLLIIFGGAVNRNSIFLSVFITISYPLHVSTPTDHLKVNS